MTNINKNIEEKVYKIMETVNIHQAKTNLSRLLLRVELGEEITISNRGSPIAKLVPFHSSSNRQNCLGQDKGRFIVPAILQRSLAGRYLDRIFRNS